MSIEALRLLVWDDSLTPSEKRLFLYLVEQMQHETGEVRMYQREIADALSTAQPNISRGLKKLLAQGLICKIRGGYQVLADAAWYGDAASQNKALANTPKDAKQLYVDPTRRGLKVVSGGVA